MRKIKEVLRLRFDLGLHQDQIARSCSIGQATVHRYLERAKANNLGWPLPDDIDDRRLNELLFPARPLWPHAKLRSGLDFGQIHSQLQTHKHLTLQLLWEEYRETEPSGYGYSRYVVAEIMLRDDLKAMTEARHRSRARNITFILI
jgi:transposase